MTDFSEIDKMFENMVLAKKPKKAKKISTGDDPILKAASEVLKRERVKAREKRGYQSGSGYEYVKRWTADGKTYTYVTKARVKWEEYTGHFPEDHEQVLFVDKTLKGEALYAKENLALGFKKGTSLSTLTCTNCGCRGQWKIET